MAVINLSPALKAMFDALDSRLRKIENSTVFKAPAVPSDPSNLTNGQIWYDTTQLKFETYDNGVTRPLGELKYYGNFYDLTTQSAANTTTAYVVNIGNTVAANGVSIVSGNQITVAYSGVWNLQFSLQLLGSDTSLDDVQIWLRQNGTDVPNSTTYIAVPAKHGSISGAAVAAWNFFATMNAGDYLQLMWQTDSTTNTIAYRPAGTTPTTPVTPSVIVTMNQVAW